ncbi:DNA-binding LytR/AlgR family response regulator [Catalinimonas alkaloidigena]|uniref:LytR/AlgR family response regulator transcription factor n=1 Tax=Catalinimonas alkaloidigena TaxID=1075417 RepID=UPI0024050E01|nr:LytTR family DNA-binding domain-containing protein [Catalinimonas alkaloidigena]MDF9798470.1 DNA-binding LytR/AlgR family response regulator [Catalinimonas alkaloidigena]
MKITRTRLFIIIAASLLPLHLFFELISVDTIALYAMIYQFLINSMPIVLGIFIIYFGFRYLQTQKNEQAITLDQQSSQSILKIAVQSGDKILLLSLDKIASFYARNNYVYAYTDEAKEYLVEHTLSALEEKLPPQFVRVHRSSIINEDYVQSIERGKEGKHTITLEDQKNKKIHVSQSYGQVVRKMTAL